MCENCLEPYVFSPLDKNNEYICPECGEVMMYFGTEEIDPNTKKVINRYDEAERKQANPGKPIVEKPQVTCPFCQLTNVRKTGSGERTVSLLGLGLLSNKINKSFKCKSCGGTF